jgi:hypothetical protein
LSVAPDRASDAPVLASGLDALSAQAKRALAQGLGLRAVTVPPELARLAAGRGRGPFAAAPRSVARRRREHPPQLPAGELPAWCAAWFSPEALLTRVPAGALPLVAEAVHAYVDAYVELARTSEPDANAVEAISAGQRGYARAHIEHDRGLGLLKKLFDPALAERFLTEVLFPERTPSWP